ncbi:hypothetical protein CRG98_040933 [Punica granatum]|uniref:SOSEKI DIX-like domain-containing protein n=1 Tax=Punica granatum TaxID=22663 RepID=A0A2I0I3U7_PUNGR|nr:hypothetical protein CRG98_040933 [Punica granatum]
MDIGRCRVQPTATPIDVAGGSRDCWHPRCTDGKRWATHAQIGPSQCIQSKKLEESRTAVTMQLSPGRADVIHHLNILPGTSMARPVFLVVETVNADRYVWSYNSGFVWQDLTENDFIYPSRGNEYVLKGRRRLANLPGDLQWTRQLRHMIGGGVPEGVVFLHQQQCHRGPVRSNSGEPPERQNEGVYGPTAVDNMRSRRA